MSRRRLRHPTLRGPLLTARIYSLTRGKDFDHEPRLDLDTGEFSCTCEDFRYRRRACKHVRRLAAYKEARRWPTSM